MEQSPRNRSLSSYIKKLLTISSSNRYFTEKGRRVPSIICHSTVCICWSINSDQPILIQKIKWTNQISKPIRVAGTKRGKKSVSKSWFILFSILIGWYSWVRGFSQSQSLEEENRVPSTKSFWKSESKCNTTFWVVPAENLREQRNISKGSPPFSDRILQTEMRVSF